jgi:hypothetical protein
MQFVTSRIKTNPTSIGEALEGQKAPRTLDEIIDTLKGQKQVKTAACECAGNPPGDVQQAGTAVAEQNVEVEDAACGPATETACMAGDSGEVEVAAVSPLDEESAKGLFEDPMAKQDLDQPPLFASKKPMILKVAKKADFRPWTPEDIVKAWGNYGSQEKCVASTKSLTNDPKAYCYLLQTASEEATNLLKTASKAKAEVKVAAPKGVFKKLASLPEKDKKNLYDYWKTLYGESYAKAMLDDYVK